MRMSLIGAIVALLASLTLAAEPPAPASAPGAGIAVENRPAQRVLALSASDLAKMKRAELKVGAKQVSYAGVPLAEILGAAGVVWGGKCTPMLACYVLVEAADGYRAVFSIPEIAPELSHRQILLADHCDGKPLSAREGPFMIVEEDAKQRGRWVRQVTRISIQSSPSGTTVAAVAGNSLPAAPSPGKASRGAVYLVGMGPGDAELLTIKAARLLKQADRVYCFDYLKDEVARHVPAERLTVVPFQQPDKRAGQSEQLQRSKAELARLVAEVRRMFAAGKTVAFADAGDPTIFCPWAWVLEGFADLSPEVVSGLSSFNAANAALRRNITCRAGSILLTGGDNLGMPDENGRLTTTLVIFTQKAKLHDMVPRLAARYPGDTPIAVVCEASYQTEKVVTATLATILKEFRDQEPPRLYLIYVGDGLAPSPKSGPTCPCGKK